MAVKRRFGVLGITLDVTERKGAEAEINRLNQTLTKQLTELQDKVEQLEGFEEVVVGRELKMIALEKTVEGLQRQISLLKAQGLPMSNDIVIELWHRGGHWCLKKSDDQYWYKGKEQTEWKPGLPPGMKPPGCGTGVSVRIGHLIF
jgi:hypothetical protein